MVGATGLASDVEVGAHSGTEDNTKEEDAEFDRTFEGTGITVELIISLHRCSCI